MAMKLMAFDIDDETREHLVRLVDDSRTTKAELIRELINKAYDSRFNVTKVFEPITEAK